MQVRSAACWAAVSTGGFTVVETVWPPVLTDAVILGTVPVSWSASSDRAPTALVTPLTLATVLTASLGNVIRVPGTKKSWVNFVPAGPSLARSVMTEELAAASAAVSDELSDPPGPPAKNPPPPPPAGAPPPGKPPPMPLGAVVVVVAVDRVGATVRVTMMSVPTDLSGDSALDCASLRPWETPMIPMTRPTPAARPTAVTIVRPRRRRSSFHA